MLALCGNCHPAISRLGKDKQYQIKQSPFNTQRGIFQGALVYDKRDLVFRVGGNLYENVPMILRAGDTPIIGCEIKNGQAKITLNLFSETGAKLLSVSENDIVFRIDDLWDFEYEHNVAIARYGPRKVALRIDLRKPEALIEGNLWVRGEHICLGPEKTTLPRNNQISNCRFSVPVGIQIGEPLIRFPTGFLIT